MKKIGIMLVLVVLTSSMVFAQNFKNWASGEVSILGAGARYEYMSSPNLSIGVNIYFNSLIAWHDFGTDFSLRYYPKAKMFYFGVGLGLHYQMNGFFGWSAISNNRVKFGNVIGFAVTPEFGWKIDVGAPGGFFVSPGFKIPITVGYSWWWGFGWGISFVPYVGLGYAW